MSFTLYTDGGARGNPGPAGIGCVLYSPDGNLVSSLSEYIGEKTNNEAEYEGLIRGLNMATQYTNDDIECVLDSELVVKQMRGEYKVKKDHLKALKSKAESLGSNFASVTFTHVTRDKNSEADLLVNQAIDEAS